MDTKLRELERQIQSGNEEAKMLLEHEKLRSGQNPSLIYLTNQWNEISELVSNRGLEALTAEFTKLWEKHPSILSIEWDFYSVEHLPESYTFWDINGFELNLENYDIIYSKDNCSDSILQDVIDQIEEFQEDPTAEADSYYHDYSFEELTELLATLKDFQLIIESVSNSFIKEICNDMDYSFKQGKLIVK